MWLTTKSNDADKWLSRGAHWLKLAWGLTKDERIEMFQQFRYCARLSNDGLPMDTLTGMSATKVVDSMPHLPEIKHDVPPIDDNASYSYGSDTIHMLTPERLAHHPDWWDYVLFHELGHSTENSSRLNHRWYRRSRVELAEVEIAAEFTAVYLAIQCGMTLYLEETLIFLQRQMKSTWPWTRGAVLEAGAKFGERAASYILGEVTA